MGKRKKQGRATLSQGQGVETVGGVRYERQKFEKQL